MAYAESFNQTSGFGSAASVDRKEIERILHQLISKSAEHGGAIQADRALLNVNFDDWKRGQLEFAKRLARISAEQARRAEKLRIRHRRVSAARRAALILMVVAINLPIFL